VTPPRAAAHLALGLAVEQLEALRRGDVDDYLNRARAHERACSVVLDLPLDVFDSETRALLDELIATNWRAAEEMVRLKEDTLARLRRIARGRGLATAYLAAPPPEGLQSLSA
jgi:hypothetical protein